MNIPRLFIVSLIAIASLMLSSVIASSNIHADETIPEALVISGVDVEGDYLFIYGHNFDIGPQDPVVILEGMYLPVEPDHSDEAIIANLSSFPGKDDDGYFLVTVETGTSLEHRDTHDLHRGLADPAPFSNQLHIRYHQVILDEAADQMEITIFGYDFMNGYWPPVVRVGDAALSVDSVESDEALIVATGNIPDSSQPEQLLLTVQTGNVLEDYDVVLAKFSSVEVPPDPPVEGEQSDEEVGLYWKEGTWKPTVLCFGFPPSVPKYYELTRDYEIDLSEFFDAYRNGSPLIRLPRMAVRYRDWYDHYRHPDLIFALMLKLPEIPFTQHTENGYKWDFISIEKRSGHYSGFPIIKMKKGYRWDGTTRPCKRYDSEFRAGLVHDSMYDLIRIGAIEWKESYSGAGKNQRDRNEVNNRELADMLFYWVSLQDRERLGLDEPGDPDATYYTLQHDGMGRANRHIEELARWRFHTLADADLSVGSYGMAIDQDGKKSLTSECVETSDYFELDASFSRPISPNPIAEKHYTSDGNEMHETTWQWNLNGGTVLIPKQQNKVGESLDVSKLTTGMTVEALVDKGFEIGPPNTITLYIDKGKNPWDPNNRKTYYEKAEDINVTMNYDSEPPVVSCPDNIVTECTGPDGALVEFQAGASDACEGILVPTCDPASGTNFQVGENSTKCNATDRRGNTGRCSFEVTVEDTTKPVITSISVTPDKLWPPNGKMLPIEVNVTVIDICDSAPNCSITSIASGEPGDDSTDSEITGDLTANLRSKRLGTGNGRTYTISVECRDAAGNTTAGMTTVSVPHDRGKASK